MLSHIPMPKSGHFQKHLSRMPAIHRILTLDPVQQGMEIRQRHGGVVDLQQGIVVVVAMLNDDMK
jgi:hypothetical protein